MNRIRSERDAFRLAIGAVIVVAVGVAVGWLTTAWAGIAVGAVLMVGGLLLYETVGRAERRDGLHAAAVGPHPHAGAARRHVLVVANAPLSGAELAAHLRDGDTVVDVLAPVLTTRTHYAMSDFDHEQDDARQRLLTSLDWARGEGIRARGEVGDPSPTVALEDELRDVGADEVIVVTRRGEHETWQVREELKRLKAELDVSVTHLAVD
jgi:GABA permease